MQHHQILILLLLTLAGAWISAEWEAWVYHRKQDLNHTMLATIRLAAALMFMNLPWLKPMDPSFWTLCMTLLMMAGAFAPAHRTLLNVIRMKRYKVPIEWSHLGKGFYDTLLPIPNVTARFLVMCAVELFIAAAMYQKMVGA